LRLQYNFKLRHW